MHWAERKHFRRLRRAAGYHTQSELAEKIGVAVGTIGRIERADMGASNEIAQKIAEALGKSVVETFTGAPRRRELLAHERELLHNFRQLEGLSGGGDADFVLALVLSLSSGGERESSIEAARVFCELRRRDSSPQHLATPPERTGEDARTA